MRMVRLLSAMALFWCVAFSVLAGTRGAMNNGNMEIGVNWRSPPSTADISLVKAQLQRASQILCDATDGQVRIKKAWLTAGGAAEDEADIWVWPQGGRSGVSFYFNGGNLGAAGRHIDIFNDGKRADILAHELGHHAFGLGDEYDEQSRWGGPCGIGPGFDAGAFNEQSHSIMQQIGAQQCATPDAANPGLFIAAGGGCFTNADCGAGQQCQPVLMSELSVASNHDPLRGDNMGCAALCTDTNCNLNWNSGTTRFEATQHTLVHGGKSDWEILKQNYPFITIPAGLPVAVAPGGCTAAVEFDERVVGSDQVMLIIDRSGSMSIPVAPGATETRMDYAKAAARAFVQLQGPSGAYQMGLVSFSTAATRDRALTDLAAGDVNSFINNKINTLTAGGTTAIGDALLATQFEFQGVATAGRVRTAFLLSDGQNNAGSDPRSAADTLKAQGVRIFSIPVGDVADRALMGEIASASGGQMLEASGGQPLPAIYAELAARIEGHALIVPRIETQSRGQINKRAIATTFHVEQGTTELIVFISAKSTSVANWGVSPYLVAPGGTYYYENQLDVTSDPYFKIVRVQNPTEGDWTFGSYASTSSSANSYLVIYGKNPNSDCFAGMLKTLVKPGETAKVLAGANYGGDLMTGVTFTGEVIAPNGAISPITMIRDPLTGSVSANFSSFSGRGVYEVRVTCDVAAGAQQYPGEKTTGPARVLAPVPAFKKTASAHFFYKAPTFPTCADETDNGDCDNDGIPNGREPDGDLDQDGIPNRYDSDANGDDIPDLYQGVNGAFILPPGYVPFAQMYPPRPEPTYPPAIPPTYTTPPVTSGASSLIGGSGLSHAAKAVLVVLVGYLAGFLP